MLTVRSCAHEILSFAVTYKPGWTEQGSQLSVLIFWGVLSFWGVLEGVAIGDDGYAVESTGVPE